MMEVYSFKFIFECLSFPLSPSTSLYPFIHTQKAKCWKLSALNFKGVNLQFFTSSSSDYLTNVVICLSVPQLKYLAG